MTEIKKPATELIRHLPQSPGVYLMKDGAGTILYVGKAANLRHRVSSYFISPQKLTAKLKKLTARISDVDFFVTASEQEALILELNLIKRHHPSYNVSLKDDKTFPYLKINTKEDWPRIYVTRRLEQDGSHYFGPFASAKSIRQTLKTIRRIFPFRSCRKQINGTDARPCLQYHIGNCPAPCIGALSRRQYARIVKEIILFLEGKQERVVRQLKQRMNQAAEALEFEKAAAIRDQIEAIQAVIEGQRIAARVRGEQDVIAFAAENNQACVQVIYVRNGKIIGRESFTLQGTSSEPPARIMTDFIKQFYDASPYIPPRLVLQHPVEDTAVIASWLSAKRGGKVRLQVPARGGKKQLVATVAENARLGLEQLKFSKMATAAAALDEIREMLELPRTPARIEGYDISDIQGTAAVGSMVVFEDGKPKPSLYRRFRIKTVAGNDDYAMLREVLRRRFKRLRVESDKPPLQDAWIVLPDLVLIDGGRGHLNTALAIMQEMGAGNVPTISLAKENEAIFQPQKPKPLILPGASPGLQLLQRLRDEAHRFAISYHKKVHQKETFTSALDEIPGIGKKRRRALLKKFGSVPAIREASLDELADTEGMNQNIARKIKEYL